MTLKLHDVTSKRSELKKMAAFSNSEKQSIKDSVKSLKKYGSTCNHMKRSEYYVTHIVQKTDTLQGLALRYNTTTEQIRRVNRLFASDSLFLRDTLKIPVTKEIANSFETNNQLTSGQSSRVTSSFSADSISNEEEKSANDFLGKIDSSIANTRAQVRLVQAQSNFINSTDHVITGRKNRSSQDSYASSNSSSDMLVTPQAVVLNKGRKVKSSLQRLEKEQDELFEL